MNAFTKVIAALGLNSDSQGDNGWLYALLQYAGGDYEGGDTYPSNAVAEVLFRLEARAIGPHSLAKIRMMLNTLQVKYAS